jgi:hypothetical protein
VPPFFSRRWDRRRPTERTRGGDHAGDTAPTLNLLKALGSSDRFRRDGPITGIFHPGRISFRELSPRDSLHVIIDGDRVSAHVDDVCPFSCIPGGTVSLSWVLILAHNLASLAADVGRRVRGLHGQQRCNLGCEMVWVDDDDEVDLDELATDLRAGGSSAAGARPEGRG